ncbi:hypothetical protein G432_18835 [Sphingomonas sp. MM-1]|uniref:Uncharacterized protein n=1 Tax=Sphingobium scionense TaxID=1404341 RepID=A0A7W6LU30_9SPHN|nr:hypothetical protein G432_18835 [Sphingomonas sp. MM-1]MBB4150167.1 hypothetical protein [Sphingobium scionense]
MVAIVLAAISEGVSVRLIASRVEQSAWRTVARDAFAFEIAGVPGKRCCTIFDPLVPDNPHLDDDASIR